MPKYVLALLVGVLTVLATTQAWAQPTFSLRPEQQIGNNGDNVCLQLVVDDFTDLLTFDYEIAFDSSVIAFDRVQALSLSNLTAGDFTLSAPGGGRLMASWEAATAGAGIGQDHPDNTPIAEICFDIIGVDGESSTVSIADAPNPVVTRQFSGGRNIGLFKESGLVAVGLLPLHIDVGSGSGVTNGSVCVDITADQYRDILSFQFSLGWDPSILRFNSVTSLNPNISGFTQAAFGQPDPGKLGVTYFVNPGGSPASLPDGDILFSVCFTILGQCDESSLIEVTEDPSIIDVFNSTAGRPIGFTSTSGQVDVFGCGGGLSLIGAVRTAAPGQTVCIPFTVSGFQNISEMVFDITWNPAILQFDNLRIGRRPPFGFGMGSFDQSNVGTGTLSLDWDGITGWTLPNGQELFELCFTVVGGFGTNGSILPDALGGTVIQGNTNIGLNPRPGEVVILPSQPLSVNIETLTNVSNGPNQCVDVTVEDFTDLTTVRFSLVWEPSILTFSQITNLSLPGLTAGNFTVNGDNLSLDWWTVGAGQSVPDGGILFSVCYDVSGPPNACAPVEVSASPVPSFVEADATQGFDIGLVSTPGEVCLGDPTAFELELTDASTAVGGRACIDAVVTGFTNVTEYSFTIDYDETRYQYLDNTEVQQVRPGGAPDLVTEIPGYLLIDFDRGVLGPQTIADGEVAFTVCFEPLVNVDACHPLSEEDPTQNSATTLPAAGTEVSLVYGELCTEAGMMVMETVTNASCSNLNDGAIALTVDGGSGTYTYRWLDASSETGPTRNNLEPGTYEVTVRDVNTATSRTLTITVGFDASAPLALAGPDSLVECGGPPVIELDATATDVSNGETVQWRKLQGGGSIFSGGNSLTPRIFGVGFFELTVTSPSGCIDRDTVEVSRQPQQAISVLQQGDIPCGGGVVTLEIAAQPAGSYSFVWSTTNGNFVSTDLTTALVQVDAAGDYRVETTDDISFCTTITSLTVNELIGTAVAEAGDPQVISCSSTDVQLGSALTTEGADYEILWSTPNGALTGPTTAAFVTATAAGRYFIEVTDIPTGCVAIDSVDVTQDADLPDVNAGLPQVLTCAETSVELLGSGSTGSDFTITWTTTDGTLAPGTETGLTATATAVGTYTLSIENTVTGCGASSTVVVSEDTDPVDLMLPAVFTNACGQQQPLLAAGIGADSANYRIAWVDAALDTIARTASLTGYVDGDYTLVATDLVTGCTSLAPVTITTSAAPVVVATMDETLLTCTRDTLIIDLTGSRYNPATDVISWASLLVPTVDPANPLRFFVVSSGAYQPIISSSPTCADTLDRGFAVTTVQVPIQVEAGPDLNLPCANTSVLSAATLPTGSTEVFSWSSESGSPIADPASIGGGFSESGKYYLNVENTFSGCTGIDSLEVTANPVNLSIDLGDDLQLDCDSNPTTVTAAIVAPDQQYTVDWVVLSGGGASVPTGEQVTFTDAGVYVANLTYIPNGCTASDTLEVVVSGLGFTLSLPDTLSTECGVDTFEIRADLVADAGVDVNLLWETTDGSILRGTDSVVAVLAAGTYSLTATNVANNCTSSAGVVIRETVRPSAALVSFEAVECDPEGELRVVGVTNPGSWELIAGQGGLIMDASADTTTFIGEPGEQYVVTYRQADEACAPEATDSVRFSFTADSLSVSDDLYTVQVGRDTLLIPASNDDAPTGSSYTLLDDLEGVSLSASGTLQMDGQDTPTEFALRYEVCDELCGNSCDTAVISVIVQEEVIELDIPNAITPDGDGANDVFIVEELLQNPERYENARFTVFNRWGDVLYEAQPYNNDWNGVNNDGQPLPQGTYYYVLELTLSNDAIFKGHVTVLVD